MRLGGKAGFASASRLSPKARQSSESESLAPLADDLTGRVQSCGDDIVGQAFIGEENDFGPDDITIR